ncbi:MAG: HAMP domain-containing sensor histidine kinase [Myxococcota bacterium]
MRLATRLTAAITLTTAATMLTSFAVVFYAVDRDELRDIDQALHVQGMTTAELIMASRSGFPEAKPGLSIVPESLAPLNHFIAVYDHRSRVVSATRNLRQAPDLAQLPPEIESGGVGFNLTTDGVSLRGMVLPIQNTGFKLLYAAPRKPIDDDLQFLFRMSAAIFLIGTVVISIVARLIGLRMARDVERIAATAQRVARGDLGARTDSRPFQSSETKTLAADLDHMVAQLSLLVDSQRTFISYAAHELRSPLAAIRGELQLALRRQRSVEEYEAALVEVLADVEALTQLAEGLLTLARVQGQGPSGSALLSEVLSDAARMSRGLAELKSVEILEPALSGAAASLRVPGSRTDLARLFRNLIDNAIAHSPKGAPVRIEVEPKDSGIEVAVRDHGAGVAAADQPHVFEPFYRGATEAGSEWSGVGLGLAIARGIARASGGELSLDTTSKEGARFVVVLPRSSG